MITDEYKIKKSLKVILKITKINHCNTHIDMDGNRIEVRFSGGIKDLEPLVGPEPILREGWEQEPLNMGIHPLTSGIDPVEIKMMKEQIKAYMDRNGNEISVDCEDFN
jgi:hypothetical protein